MGQILSHGVYLPNEGERNCYAGLASNWQILNTAVGNIAEKAPLVHTHGNITNDGKVGTTANLPLITGTGGVVQAGSFGNQANTFCEGNDSRLSDARIPVAHTHTKSDVTDLLNSNFIPSANDAYDLGSASKQWLNTYSKGYYYNGVAWGLDKSNTWTGDNVYSVMYLKYNNSGQHADLYWKDENDNVLCNFRHNEQSITLGKRYTGKTAWYQGAQIVINQNGTVELKSYDGTNNHSIVLNSQSLYPVTTNDLNLGASTNKWKSLNGVNPGALSLPNVNAVTGSSNTQLQDISGDLVQDQYFNCYFTPRMDGWAYIALNCSSATIRSGHSSFSVMVKTAGIFANALYAQSFTKTESAWSNLVILFPVTANKEITLECTFTGFSVTKAYVIPAQGNV